MPASIARRVRAIDWEKIRASVDERGYALTPPLLTSRECADLRGLHGDSSRFRATIDMERHRFGRGEYRYFSRPLPRLVLDLRRAAGARGFFRVPLRHGVARVTRGSRYTLGVIFHDAR